LKRRLADVTLGEVSVRSHDLAAELKQVIRLAGHNPEALEGQLPTLGALHRVALAGQLDEPARVHLIVNRLIPQYLDRLPDARDCRAIRELLTWQDEQGESRSLTTRYHKASAHLVSAASDFGRRQEPRLLLECARRFITLDHEDRLADHTLDGAPASGVAMPAAPVTPAILPDPAPSGIVEVHRSLDYSLLVDAIAGAQRIAILNTWVPELNILADALLDALARDASVSILMLHPESPVARLRSEALQRATQARFREDRVRPGVRHCLEVLAAIARSVDADRRGRLRVRLYDSMPSIAVYAVDDRAFVSVFLHGRLAVHSVQLEVQGRDSLMGRQVFEEVQALWEIGREFEDLEQWETQLQEMAREFGVTR
jgi:hypothetical protein